MEKMVFINRDKLSGCCNSSASSLIVVVVSCHSSHPSLISSIADMPSQLARSCTQPLKKISRAMPMGHVLVGISRQLGHADFYCASLGI